MNNIKARLQSVKVERGREVPSIKGRGLTRLEVTLTSGKKKAVTAVHYMEYIDTLTDLHIIQQTLTNAQAVRDGLEYIGIDTETTYGKEMLREGQESLDFYLKVFDSEDDIFIALDYLYETLG